MLSYQEFELELIKGLEERFADAKIETQSIYKFNRIKKAIIIKVPGSVHPTVYPEELYESYQRMEDIEFILDSIDSAIEFDKVEEFKSIIKDWEQAREYVYPYIVNLDKNKWCMDCNEYVYKEKLDLAYGLYLELPDEKDGGRAYVNVTKKLLKLWNVSEDEAFAVADKNAKYYVRSMKQIIAELMDLACEEINVSEDNAMYVLSNKTKNRGAAGMFDLDLLSKTAEDVQSDFYILASSIHEVILVLEKDAPSKKTLLEVIGEGNNQADEEDFLSNNLYFYNKEKNEVSIVEFD